MSESPVYLLVDGHSVIFAWPELRQAHQRNPRQAREALIQHLRQLNDTSSWRVTLVFDGQQGSTPSRRKGELVVLYSKKGQTADSIIEQLVGTSGQASRIQVVTADSEERRTIESLGAAVVGPDWLRDEIRREDADFARRLENVNREAQW
ncbi:MAG: NYN domain-containing protein [Verrucomicrobiota bacterium]